MPIDQPPCRIGKWQGFCGLGHGTSGRYLDCVSSLTRAGGGATLDGDPNHNRDRGIEARVRMDTVPFRVRAAAHATFSTCAVLASLTLLLGGCAGSRAVGRAGDRLLWAHDDRAYLAMHDGATIVEGDSVWFDEGRTMIAAGHVTSVLHGELALVTITAGSLGAAVRPERLLVSVMPRSTPHLGSVRVALPANGRGNLIVRCGGVLPHLPREAPAYRTDTLDARHLRLTRSGEAASSNGWPDTLNVVL